MAISDDDWCLQPDELARRVRAAGRVGGYVEGPQHPPVVESKSSDHPEYVIVWAGVSLALWAIGGLVWWLS